MSERVFATARDKSVALPLLRKRREEMVHAVLGMVPKEKQEDALAIIKECMHLTIDIVRHQVLGAYDA